MAAMQNKPEMPPTLKGLAAGPCFRWFPTHGVLARSLLADHAA
jgi:hypothetical protein